MKHLQQIGYRIKHVSEKWSGKGPSENDSQPQKFYNISYIIYFISFTFYVLFSNNFFMGFKMFEPTIFWGENIR